MEGFSYTDIFDTKGIEYIIVIGFLLIIIPVWIWLNKPVSEKSVLLKSISGLTSSVLRIPQGLFYNKNHTWAFLEKNGSAKVGLDDLLLHLTGGVSVDFLKDPGDKVRKGDMIAMVSHDQKSLKISSPVSGEIQKLNKVLSGKEGIINDDPYNSGWLYKLRPEKWTEETSCCKMGEDAVKWSESELSRCRDFLTNALRGSQREMNETVLQEGGALTDFPLADMPGDVWNKFQKEFLD